MASNGFHLQGGKIIKMSGPPQGGKKKNPTQMKKLNPYEAYKIERIKQLKEEDPDIQI